MNPDQEKFLSDFRVGIISAAAVILIIAGVTLAGGAKGLFLVKKERISAWLPDVNGLKKGAAVTMGGMTVGEVKSLRFTPENSQAIEVLMEVRAEVRNRIREDSAATVRTQGMLGDRYVEISSGTEAAAPLAAGRPIVGADASNFDQVLEETEKMLSAVNEKQGSVGKFFYDSEFHESLTQALESMRVLIEDFRKNPKRYVKLSLF